MSEHEQMKEELRKAHLKGEKEGEIGFAKIFFLVYVLFLGVLESRGVRNLTTVHVGISALVGIGITSSILEAFRRRDRV